MNDILRRRRDARLRPRRAHQRQLLDRGRCDQRSAATGRAPAPTIAACGRRAAPAPTRPCWALNAKTDLQYFLPLAGILAAHRRQLLRESKSLPKFPPNSDTEITEPALSDSLKTVRKSARHSTSRWRVATRRTISHALHGRSAATDVRVQRPTRSQSRGHGHHHQHAAEPHVPNDVGGPATRSRCSERTDSAGGSINSTCRRRASRQTGNRWSYVNGDFRRDPTNTPRAFATKAPCATTRFGRSKRPSVSPTRATRRSNIVGWATTSVPKSRTPNNARVSFALPDEWRLSRLLEKPSVEVQSSYPEDSGPNVRATGRPQGTAQRERLAQRQRSHRLRPRPAIQQPVRSVRVGRSNARRAAVSFRTHPAARPAGLPATRSLLPRGAGLAARRTAAAGARARCSGNWAHAGQHSPHQGASPAAPSSSYLRVPDRPDWSYQLGPRQQHRHSRQRSLHRPAGNASAQLELQPR